MFLSRLSERWLLGMVGFPSRSEGRGRLCDCSLPYIFCVFLLDFSPKRGNEMKKSDM